MHKILTIGEILVEIIATEKGDGFRKATPLIGPFPSGAPAIFIDQAGKLGQPCAIISRVGGDDFGTVNLERLKGDGVDISGIEVDPLATTGSAFVRYRPMAAALSCSTSATAPAADHARRAHDPARRRMQPCPCHGLFALRAERGREHSRRDRHRQGRRGHGLLRPESSSGDPQKPRYARGAAYGARRDRSLPAERRRAFPLHRSKDGKSGGCGTPRIRHQSRRRQTRRGGRQLFRCRGGALPAGLPGRGDHPTGAGDCFGATFVSFWLNGASPREALEFAAASGARAVMHFGPMEGASTRAELERFISEQQA